MVSGKGHIVLRVVQGVVIAFVLIQLAVCLAFQIPSVQTYAVKTVTGMLGDKINGEISVGRISFVFFNRLVLRDVTVCGHGAPAPWGESDTCLYCNPGDTLGHVGKLSVAFSVRDFLNKRIGARKVVLENGFFYLLTEDPDRRSNLTRIFNLPLPDPDKEHPVFPDLFADDIRLHNCGFSLGNPYVPNKKEPVPGQMLYNNLKIKNICAHFRDFKTINGEINCRILHISANESSGAGIGKMSGVLHLGPRGSGMDDMYLKDLNGTVLQAEHLYFNYSSKEEIADWVNSVVMDVKFRETTFNFNSLRYFVPSMENNHLVLTVRGGEVKGPVSNIDARGLEVSPAGSRTTVSVDAVLSGIPDMPNTQFNGRLKDVIHAEDISAILSGWSGKPAPEALSSIPAGRTVYQDVAFSGPFKKLEVSGSLRLNAGLLRHFVRVSLFTADGISVEGEVHADSLDLGYALDNDILGKTDFKLRGKLETGRKTSAEIEYFNINRLGLKGYDYRGMYLAGEVSDTACLVWFESRDSNCRAELEIEAFMDEKGKKMSGNYSVRLKAPYVDFKKLNLITNSEKSLLSDVSMKLDVDFDGEENAIGNIRLNSLSYQNSKGTVSLDTISVVSAEDGECFDVELRSPYADIDYHGEEPLLRAIMRAKDIAMDRQFGEVFGGRNEKVAGNTDTGNDTLRLKTYETWRLLNVLSEGLYVAAGTELNMFLSDRDSLSLALESGRLAKKNSYVKDLNMKIDAPDSVVKVNMTSSEIKVGNSSVKGNIIDIVSEKGLIDFDYVFLNGKGDTLNPMCVATDVSFSRDENGYLNTDIDLDSAIFFLNENRWKINPSRVGIGHNLISVEDFEFHGHTASLKINGIISENPEDEMTIELDSLDLSLLNNFLTSDMSLGGNITGHVDIKDFFDQSNFVVNVEGHDISVFDNPLGFVQIMSKWDPATERMNLVIDSKYQERAPISMTGHYRHKDRDLSVNVGLDELSLTYARPFLKDILRIDGGDLSGHLILHGTNGKYSIDSEGTMFHNFAFAPVFTEVPYLLNGGMSFTEDRIDLNDWVIEDKYGHRATITGAISHDFLSDMNLDLRLAFKDLECLDIKEKPGAVIYGTASASGTVGVTGPVNDILIDAVVRTGDKTSIHVPLTNSYAAASNDILVFRTYNDGPVDPYEALMTSEETEVKEKGRIRIKADATLYDDALVTVELDKNLGNIVECHGNARVNLDLDPSMDKTELRGQYTVTSGLARYSFAGIIARDFSLMEGGSLTFRGPISATQLNVGATYHTKTSVATLVADTSSVGSRQNVYASVGLKGSLSNPTFNFKIDIPDLDPLTKGRVESAFSTEAKVQKQFMALMLTGSFIPDEQSGVSENSNILYSNVSEMISNHVNNILRTLNVPLDVGLNYQRNSRQNSMIDVNLSYQAFNNRLILNGSVGNGTRNQNWVGNFEAQLKMDKRGKFRFSLFTRAADQYTNFIDNSQRNGFGFSFQDEFDRFGEIFMSRRKKEAWELERIEKVKAELLEDSVPMEETGQTKEVSE